MVGSTGLPLNSWMTCSISIENCSRESSFSFSLAEDVVVASKLPEASLLRKIGFTDRPGGVVLGPNN
jgi:hypothetical protein